MLKCPEPSSSTGLSYRRQGSAGHSGVVTAVLTQHLQCQEGDILSPAPFFGLASVNISTFFLLCFFALIFCARTLWTTLMSQRLCISHNTSLLCGQCQPWQRGRESWGTGLNFNSVETLPATNHSLLRDNSSLETILSRESQGRRDSRASICLLGNWLDLQGRSILHFP